jgi:hypothetical protein
MSAGDAPPVALFAGLDCTIFAGPPAAAGVEEPAAGGAGGAAAGVGGAAGALAAVGCGAADAAAAIGCGGAAATFTVGASGELGLLIGGKVFDAAPAAPALGFATAVAAGVTCEPVAFASIVEGAQAAQVTVTASHVVWTYLISCSVSCWRTVGS